MNLVPEKPLITDLDYKQLLETIVSFGEPGYRARQIWEGVYITQVEDLGSITNLPTSFRNKLKDNFSLSALSVLTTLSSRDHNTEKVLFETRDNKRLESVLMTYDERNTLCISTQSGCAMGCSFCATGQMGFFRSLTTGEIIEQVLYFSRQLLRETKKVTNIVFMGMGEPFHNYEATLKTVDILNDKTGYNLGSRRFTISTVGIVPQIIRFADEERQVNLAISLHSIDNEIRSSMMPVNKKYPVEDLLKACAYYVEKTNRRISFEWALIEGINDSPEMARMLAGRLHHLMCHVNLIQLNPTTKYSGRGSSKDSAQRFMETLESLGIPCTIRLRRGIDIQAGCGQLASSNL
jgi:23S rRNA (adenine2503-C2)-methyltransferase